MPKAKSVQLRQLSADELLKRVQTERETLASLRVGFDHKTHQSRVGKMQVAKKNIARMLTIYTQKKRAAAFVEYADKKHKPRDLLPKTTKRQRMALKPEQRAKVVPKVLRARKAFPMRKFLILAA
eukprot:Protomagalhaensia_wolfi_Nauph_80__5212@NODE_55_length_4132_cov_174_239922_g46_i0_p5_GENE_NODE_55_length_4132_cov_174_239922_g46_i0NODE_55_length_4132_cov_174_239922_g46_i0_p5_ORF_typecomplete_len125_score30_38Ribosomal_L29/PF00831_23/3_4e10_NODE_55_length_4132_cov_174_239922_g46_i036113985